MSKPMQPTPKVLTLVFWTCEHCGLRQKFEQPNIIFEFGVCHGCGKSTKIKAYQANKDLQEFKVMVSTIIPTDALMASKICDGVKKFKAKYPELYAQYKNEEKTS